MRWERIHLAQWWTNFKVKLRLGYYDEMITNILVVSSAYALIFSAYRLYLGY